MNIHANIHYICRLSLSFLWLWTAVTSFWWGRAVGYEVLSQQGIEGVLADVCINAGSLLDAIIGIWLLSNFKMQWCYRIQIILIISYTMLLTIIDASFWLHPFGPLTKNIPILALLLVLLPTIKATDKPS
ncbi:MAG: DoxX-like family protein [Pseudomonadota bacterium]